MGVEKRLFFLLILLVTIGSLPACSLSSSDAVNDSNANNQSEQVVVEEDEVDEVLDEDEVDDVDSGSDIIDESLTEKKTNGISFDQENDETEVNPVKSDVSKYYGKWTATSDRAQYLYGNVDITINQDGTWGGTITDEKIGGKWKDFGDHLRLQSKIFSFDVAFDKTGNLIMIEKNADGEIDTVLTRK